MGNYTVPINKKQIDFTKIYRDEYAAASKSGSCKVSEKNQEYWGNEGTQLEVVEVEADGQKVYRIDEIQADGSRVGMGFTTEDGIQFENTVDSGSDHKAMTIEEQMQARADESTARAKMAIEAQQKEKAWLQARADESTARAKMAIEAQQKAVEEVSQFSDPISANNNTFVDVSQFADPNNTK